ncbi:hypothetical protein TRIATDRAFT_287556 [Trichoderma atroviride IMI 206040]|uniref:Uncharacterized protein n=1 Tax=Hypocrea atroviridis (strain ATCC 20476 / IMI 206040) TaxID=452589 RepID=G9P5Y0_HYPAI|nr:uncharacterized protein TRIATDRAFT_287556 [Trichoderma atroviride IMI 206040]EHK42204.1 hypothetical protein TRIATDRAFT_287556 [Trichoderma atroviride IMI 206040]
MKTSSRLRAMIGTFFGTGVALIAHGIGMWRDEKSGTATLASRRSRAILASTAFAAGIGELYTNTAAGNASTHIAFTIYTGMRDLMVQSRLRLHNPNTSGIKPDWTHFSIMMFLMTIIAGLVNFGMSTLASPSGQAAWAARSSFTEQLKHAVIRGVLNLIGEVGDDFLFQVIPSIRSHFKGVENPHVLRLSLKDVGYQKGYLTNAALGPWAARTGLLATTLALLGIASPCLAHNARLLEGVSDLIVGVTNGPLYEPFANSVSGQPDPVRNPCGSDEESQKQKECSQSDDAASIRSYMHPNIDMTNCAEVKWEESQGHHQPDYTEPYDEKASSFQPQRDGLPRIDECASLQSFASPSPILVGFCNIETPKNSGKNIFCTRTSRSTFYGILIGQTAQIIDTRNAMRNDWDDEVTASEEEFERKQRRATASDTGSIDLATLRRSFRLGRAMLVTTVSDIGDSMIFACIRHQAQTAAVTKANTYRLGANFISRICSFEGCRKFLFAQVRGAIKLGKMLQVLQPNWKNTVAFNGFDSKLIGVDQRLLIRYIKHRIVPILERLERVHAWNMADAVQQLVTCINLGRGQTKHPPSIVE